MAAAPRRGPEPRVQRFDPIGRVGQFPDLDREVEERDELAPAVAPRLDHRRISRFPPLGEVLEPGAGLGNGFGLVDLFEPSGDLL